MIFLGKGLELHHMVFMTTDVQLSLKIYIYIY